MVNYKKYRINTKRMGSKPRSRKGKGVFIKKGIVHSKLDPRLSFLISFPITQLKKLREEESLKLRRIEERRQGSKPSSAEHSQDHGREDRDEAQEPSYEAFSPLTTGIFFPSFKKDPNPAGLKEPYASALILSEASATDLMKLGIKVRSQAGSVYSVFIPLKLIPKLERSPAILYIELARPLFPTLNQAIPFTQINTLHTANPSINGTGVIIGVSDFNVLDIYHPDFRTAGGETRVLFLWDQQLDLQGPESSPGAGLPGFTPIGGSSYGVEYNQVNINIELNNFNPPSVPAYVTVRHEPPSDLEGHGTLVTGCAAGNGLGQNGTFVGAAPGANIIYVRNMGYLNYYSLWADDTFVCDSFSYIFAQS